MWLCFSSGTHTHAHTHRERERERERASARARERERERERERKRHIRVMRGPRLRQPKRKRVMHDHSEDRYVSGCAQSTDLVIVPFVNTPVALFASKKLVGVPLPKALLIHFLELYAVLLASLALRHSASAASKQAGM